MDLGYVERDQAGVDLLCHARAVSSDAEAAARAVIAANPSVPILRASLRLLLAGAAANGAVGGSLSEDDVRWVRATLRGKESRSKITTEEMRAMRAAGQSVREIAKAAGLTRASIYNRIGER